MSDPVVIYPRGALGLLVDVGLGRQVASLQPGVVCKVYLNEEGKREATPDRRALFERIAEAVRSWAAEQEAPDPLEACRAAGYRVVQSDADRWAFNAPNGWGCGVGYHSEAEAWKAAASSYAMRGSPKPDEIGPGEFARSKLAGYDVEPDGFAGGWFARDPEGDEVGGSGKNYPTEREAWEACDHHRMFGSAADLAEASEGFRCDACGRPEADCSADPCEAVQQDREG